MRAFRIGLVGALIAATVGLVIAAQPAGAADAPTAPFNAITIDSTGWAYINLGQPTLFDDSTATFSASPWGVNADAGITVSADGPQHDGSVTIHPPTGVPLAVGTFDVKSSYGDAYGSLRVGMDGRGCGGVDDVGTVTVSELTRNDQNAITSIAATYTFTCGNDAPMSGEVRWNSTQGYRALTQNPANSTVDFGTVFVGANSTSQAFQLTSLGSESVVFGTAALTGANPTSFSITSDTCSGQTLAFGQTCTFALSAEPAPGVAGTRTARLVLPNDTATGQRTIDLTVQAQDPPQGAAAPSSVTFPGVLAGATTPTQTVTVSNVGNTYMNLHITSVAIAGPDASVFHISSTTCDNAYLTSYPCKVYLTATPPGKGMFTATLVLTDNSLAGGLEVPLTVEGTADAEGTYYPVAPSRLLDTRTGNGAPKKPIGPAGVVHLQVTGRGGVPLTGASAVVLNVTVTGPTSNGYLTVFPTGVPRPTTSSLNFVTGWTGANSVTVGLGTNGQVDIYNSSGNTNVIVDVTGYYAAAGPVAPGGVGGQLQATSPQRILDTRWPEIAQQLRSGYMALVPYDFGPYNPHIRAFAVNVTAVNPKASGYLTTWNGWDDLPLASTLNFTPGTVVPNFAIVPTHPCAYLECSGMPAIGIYNGSGGGTDVLVDIVGVYDDSTLDGGLRFTPITPKRIADTRIGQGTTGPLGPRSTATITAPDAVLGGEALALATNVTAIAPTSSTYLTVWPADPDVPRPTASNLNPAKGQTVPNAVATLLGPTNAFNVFNYSGYLNVAVDVVGTFAPGIVLTTSLAVSRPQFHLATPRTEPLTASVRRAYLGPVG